MDCHSYDHNLPYIVEQGQSWSLRILINHYDHNVPHNSGTRTGDKSYDEYSWVLWLVAPFVITAIDN